MPPHCDTFDGPVVTAAKHALEVQNVNLILPYVHAGAESELRQAFEKTQHVRALGGEAAGLADYWFFETAVRLHRASEGAPYTGLKPAGLDWGPVVPRADRAINEGDPTDVISFLTAALDEKFRTLFESARSGKDYDINDVEAARAYVSAALRFVLYSHHMWKYIVTGE